jgi:hypothetical protein
MVRVWLEFPATASPVSLGGQTKAIDFRAGYAIMESALNVTTYSPTNLTGCSRMGQDFEQILAALCKP